jgi:ribosomal-protein-alanine N-acetyltransferase
MMPFRPPQLIESDEILLRPPAPEDAQALFDEMLSDAETMRYLPFPRHTTLDDTLEYIEESRRGWESGSLLRWLLVDKATGHLTALIQLEPRPPRAEIGVIISRQGGSRKRRAGLQVLRKLIKWLLAQPAIYRLYACCATDGPAQSAMERLGFVLEAKLTNYESRPNMGVVVGDSYLYVMTRSAAVPPATPATRWLAPEEETTA